MHHAGHRPRDFQPRALKGWDCPLYCPVVQPGPDELLLIRGENSFIVAGQAGTRFSLCIETPDDEYCQSVWPHHIIAVSAPEGGSLSAASMLFCLVRDHHLPLLVMRKDHPGSRRLRYVVSAGERILLSCAIVRGTHPEQDLLCSSAELAGILLEGRESGIHITNCPHSAEVTVIPFPKNRPDKTRDRWPPAGGGRGPDSLPGESG